MEVRRVAVWGSAVVLVILVVFLLWWWMGSRTAVDDPVVDVDREALLARIDSLERVIARKDSLVEQQPGLSAWSVRQLQRKGLEDPQRQIVDSLLARPDLIPYEGVVGGSMAFREPQVTVLSDRWILAGFDDGHIAGKMLLAYTVSNEGSISFEIIDSYRQ